MQIDKPLFQRLAIVGFGMIGSSIARAVMDNDIVGEVWGLDANDEVCMRAQNLKLGTKFSSNPAVTLPDADCVMIAAPVGAYKQIAVWIAPHLNKNTIVTDAGSTKRSVIQDLAAHLPNPALFVPGHPIAGAEKSGPEAGDGTIFKDRWCVLTPTAQTDPAALEKVTAFWRACGSNVEIMTAEHHDKVLAMTSHLPHLLAYTIVGTAANLEDHLKDEVIKFSAGGFRDATRTAAAPPIMWHDIFLNNSDAILEMAQRLQEDLAELQRAIRMKDSAKIHLMLDRANEIRARVIQARQA